MNDHMAKSVELAKKQRAKNKALYEIRHALGVSIVGAIQGAGDLDKLGASELRVLAKEVGKLVGFIFEQLESIESGADDG